MDRERDWELDKGNEMVTHYGSAGKGETGSRQMVNCLDMDDLVMIY